MVPFKMTSEVTAFQRGVLMYWVHSVTFGKNRVTVPYSGDIPGCHLARLELTPRWLLPILPAFVLGHTGAKKCVPFVELSRKVADSILEYRGAFSHPDFSAYHSLSTPDTTLPTRLRSPSESCENLPTIPDLACSLLQHLPGTAYLHRC